MPLVLLTGDHGGNRSVALTSHYSMARLPSIWRRPVETLLVKPINPIFPHISVGRALHLPHRLDKNDIGVL
jgi:hypothetical protein